MFDVRQDFEKYVTNGKNMFLEFMDLYITCNLINWNAVLSVSIILLNTDVS